MVKRILFLNLIFIGLLILSMLVYDSISIPDLCDVEGYYILDCTWTKTSFDLEENENEIELENGMIFEVMGYRFPHISSSRAIVFAVSVEMHGKENILYKVFIEDEDRMYNVMRIR